MADIDDAARGTDAGTKLLNRQPSRNTGPSHNANAAERNEPAGSASKTQGRIDDVARGIDAGTKLGNRQPSHKAGEVGKKPSTPATSPAQPARVNYPGAQGKNVWTFRPDAGNWVASKASGWDPSFPFRTLQNLLDGLKQAGLVGRVAKLAIVAHGNAPGVVQLETPMNSKTFGSFMNQLSQLRAYMRPNGKVIFLSCIAGKGEEGTTLLTDISKILPDTYVIGFEIFGGFSSNYPSEPGQIWEDIYGTSSDTPMPKNPVWLREYSYYSKWALNGNIIRFALGDQFKRDKWKCANPTCPGHQSATHQCDTFP